MLLALAGCTAIDNFDKFKPADGGAGGCTPGCTCLAANASLGVPEHCAIAASNNLSCTAAMHGADVVTLTGGDYILDGSSSPPALTLNGTTVVAGSVQNNAAVFCIGALVTSAPSRIGITGTRSIAIVADSVVRFSGTINLSGDYAASDKGALGVAGGGPGGDAENPAPGLSGGRAGLGTPGNGGSGGGGTMTGSVGGGTSTNAQMTPGGLSAGTVTFGFGGGGGGKGTTTGGGGGGGAGALQISASWQIQLDQAQINATGGGGAGGGPGATISQGAGGGGGGGSGGMVFLESPDVGVNGGCISVSGGPGGGGGGSLRGGDGKPANMCGFLGTGGVAGPQGGMGGSPNGVTPGGSPGSGIGGGGGGTGSYGRVIIRSHAPPMNGPGVVPAVAYMPAMLP